VVEGAGVLDAGFFDDGVFTAVFFCVDAALEADGDGPGVGVAFVSE
jgi:hypothetical protein